MTENKLEYWTPDPATVLRLYTEMEKGKKGRKRERGRVRGRRRVLKCDPPCYCRTRLV